MRSSQTLEDQHLARAEDDASGEPVPGLVLVFAGDKPAFEVIPLSNGTIEIGRGVAVATIDDKRMSRAHARVSFDGRVWTARDLGSRNGTAADGDELASGGVSEAHGIVRAGGSLFLLAADTRPFRAGIVRGAGDAVMGPALQRAFKAIARAAHFGRVVHITGESGSGKEVSARAFHDAGPASAGPFVAVNAATLTENMAEAMLFGARRGAYTGAVADRQGYVQSAHGGTLFLDEVAELDLVVQARLLRVLERYEVVPLGATRVERVDIRLCSATSADLRARVTAGKMRDDLYFRIATPTVVLPPLRERLEEIPWLVERAVREVEASGSSLVMHVSLVESCLLRRWPGNVRELIAEVRAAAQFAAEDGGVVLARHLDPRAGTRVAPSQPPAPAGAARPVTPDRPPDAAIEEALRAAGNSVSRAARALGMHRTQLYRWIARRDGTPKDGDDEG